MKVLYAVVLFAILGAGLAKKFTEEMLTPADRECLQELGLTTNLVVDNIDDNFLLAEGNADLNKFQECSFKKLNAIDENNALKKGALRSLMIEYIGLINPDVKDKDTVGGDAFEACKDTANEDLGIIKFCNCFVNYVSNVSK